MDVGLLELRQASDECIRLLTWSLDVTSLPPPSLSTEQPSDNSNPATPTTPSTQPAPNIQHHNLWDHEQVGYPQHHVLHEVQRARVAQVAKTVRACVQRVNAWLDECVDVEVGVPVCVWRVVRALVEAGLCVEVRGVLERVVAKKKGVGSVAALQNVAAVLTLLGGADEALGYLDKCDEVEECVEDEVRAMVQVVRGDALVRLGRAPEAVPLYSDVVERMVEKAKDGDEAAARVAALACLQLACALDAAEGIRQQDAKDPDALFQSVQQLFLAARELASAQSRQGARVECELAQFYLQHGMHKQAVQCLETAKQTYATLLHPSHMSVACVLCEMGVAYIGFGLLHKARDAYEEALGMFEETLGPTAAACAVVQRNLGAVYRGLGNLSQAVVHLREALYMRLEDPGAEDTLAVAELRLRLGQTLIQHERLVDAHEPLALSYYWLRRHYGHKHRLALEANEAFTTAHSELKRQRDLSAQRSRKSRSRRQ